MNTPQILLYWFFPEEQDTLPLGFIDPENYERIVVFTNDKKLKDSGKKTFHFHNHETNYPGVYDDRDATLFDDFKRTVVEIISPKDGASRLEPRDITVDITYAPRMLSFIIYYWIMNYKGQLKGNRTIVVQWSAQDGSKVRLPTMILSPA
nr:hypothetical protein [Candidatus Sigynarchaeota archaeon]